MISGSEAGLATRFPGGFRVRFAPGLAAVVPVVLGRQEQHLFGWWLRLPEDAQPGEVYRLDLVKRDGPTRRILGGIAAEIHVRDV